MNYSQLVEFLKYLQQDNWKLVWLLFDDVSRYAISTGRMIPLANGARRPNSFLRPFTNGHQVKKSRPVFED